MILASLGTAAHAQLVTSAPPPGFADLDAPQPAAVDIWYDGNPQGLADALVRPGFIRFDEPRAVADLLPGEVDRTAVAAALAGELEANAARVCGPVPAPDCGVLEPATAAVIFDLATFRVDVFVAPALRAVTAEAPVFLAAPSWSPSILQGLDLAASLVPDEAARAVLSSRSVIATGPARALADYGFDLEEGYFTDTLVGQIDRRGWRLEGGLDRASPVPVLGSRRFLGARLASTLDMRRDSDSVRGSSLVVVLARRSQVEVLRDGRLLTVQSLAAGTQRIDTTAFPIGSYDVTVRILSPAGIREETRFFVKSAELPPADAPQYVLEAGLFADDGQAAWPEVGSTPFIHAGMRRRLADNAGVGVDLSGTPDAIAGSADAYVLWRGLELGVNGFATSKGNFGAAVSASGDIGAFTYALAARRTVGEQVPGRIDPGDLDDDTDDIFVADDALERLTGSISDSTQFDLNLAYGFANGLRLGARAFWRDDGTGAADFSAGPNLFWPLGTLGGARFDLFGDAATNTDETFVLARLRVAFASGPWRLDGSTSYRRSDRNDDDTGPGGGVTLSRAWLNDAGGRLQATLRAEQTGADSAIGAGLEAEGALGRVELSVDRDLAESAAAVALTARTTAVAAGGGLAIGGADAQSSALLLVTEGTGDADFEVLVDDRPHGRLGTGERLVLPLRSYESYRVRLRQSEGSVVAYDGETREQTLYPGTVATERWTVAPLVSVFGRLLDDAGAPLSDAQLATEPAYATDGSGFFQADLGTTATHLEATSSGKRCRAALPELVPSSTYQRIGDVICVAIDGSAAPLR